jgi:tetratricopeptide (TPR) repeat protein
VAVAQDDELTLEPVRLEEDPQARAEMTAAIKAYKKDDFLRASLMLYELVSRHERAVGPYEQKAEYTLGKTLYRLGLYQASLNFFDRVVKAGSEHRYFKATCKWLYYLSRKISGDPGLLEKIAKFKPAECPVEFRSELAFLVGQYHYKRGAIKTAIRELKTVKMGSRYYPKAKFLEGISYVRLDKPRPAVSAFKTLMRATLEAKNVSEDLRYFNQLATLSMARVFYSTGQFDKAAKYYDRIPLDSTLWLDALFEASWTFFRWNNHEKALGNLHTLNSPFFSDEYVPEAGILEAVIFYSNCNFGKARDAIHSFLVTYEPLRDEIRGYLDSFKEPSELYRFLGKLQDSGSAISPRVSQILSAAFGDKTLKRLNAYIRELDRETKMVEKSRSTWARSRLAQTIITDTEVIKSLAVHEGGTLARKRLQRVVDELTRLISDARKIDFEITSAEKVGLESQLLGAKAPKTRARKGSLYATDEEHIYWPYKGEYWRDELGYYLYTIKSECGR